MKAQHEYQLAARPVLFESESEDYPYWGLGSSVLVWNAGHYYLVTAKHVIENQQQTFSSLRVFPADGSKMSLPFNALLKIIPDDSEADFSDIYILQIDIKQFKDTGDAMLTAQDLEAGIYHPNQLAQGDALLVVGFPEEARSVDYEQFKIKYKRHSFEATYSGAGTQKHCHQLKINDNLGFSTYNGLSGAPVFRIVTKGAFAYPMLVGIMVRGTAESQIGHFVGGHVLARATKDAASCN